MNKILEMHGIECDQCHALYIDDDTGFCAWNDPGLAEESANDSGWYTTEDGKDYCPNCYKIDEDDNLLLKEEKI